MNDFIRIAEEMRDAFYEYFKAEIEFEKELSKYD